MPVVGDQAKDNAQGKEGHDPDNIGKAGQGHEEVDQAHPHADGAIQAGSEKPGHFV